MFLEVKNLKKYYGNGDSQICVLNGVNFSVNWWSFWDLPDQGSLRFLI